MALLKVPAFIDRYIDKAFVFNELILFSQGGIYIFVPKVSCFVRNQWCPSKVSTNCMHYDDSEWFNEFDQCVLKKTKWY